MKTSAARKKSDWSLNVMASVMVTPGADPGASQEAPDKRLSCEGVLPRYGDAGRMSPPSCATGIAPEAQNLEPGHLLAFRTRAPFIVGRGLTAFGLRPVLPEQKLGFRIRLHAPGLQPRLRFGPCLGLLSSPRAGSTTASFQAARPAV
jgi:hypothetical protein